MDFSTAFFGKSLSNLLYEDIVSYFLEVRGESELIEFKSFVVQANIDSGLNGVIKGISAFLNSNGGIVIWGAPKGSKQEGKSEKVFVGQLTPINELIEKDTLINRISSAIVPLPIGIQVAILSDNDGYVYVFEVQPSNYKPHQFETRYYVRLDGQSKPAPHYLIDALMKQITFPNIAGVIQFGRLRYINTGAIHLSIIIGLFNFTELQNEESVSFRLLCIGGYFKRGREVRYTTQKPDYNMKGQELIYENFANVLHFGTPNIHEDLIVIEEDDLRNNNYRLNLDLSFGGKKSPAKVSSYTLDLSKISLPCDNSSKYLTDIEENVLLSDLKRQLGNTIEKSLSTFTGRA
jgi:hypothetical protein